MAMLTSRHGLGLAMATLLAAAACGAEDTDTRPPTLAYITKAILRPNCATATCHGEHAAINGVALHDADAAYRSLVTTDPLEPKFVLPESPQLSGLMDRLIGDEVDRMPPDQPLPEADIELIRLWILDGAKNN